MEMKVDDKPVVLVTGSSGFISTRVMATLSSDYQVVEFDLTRSEEGAAGAEWIECDLTEDGSVAQALTTIRAKRGTRLASVIHVAACPDFSGEPSPLHRILTVEGTRRLLRGLQEFQVEQFVLSSSLLAVRPAEESKVVPEQSVTEVAWDYPHSQLEAERVIEQERGSIPTVILRVAEVYDEDCHSIPIAQHIRRIYEKKLENYFYPGLTTHGLPFIHLDDLIECVRKTVALRRALNPQETFVIAEPDIVSYVELQELLGAFIHGPEWPVMRTPQVVAKVSAWAQKKLAAGEEETLIKPWMMDWADMHYPVPVGRARERLGWEPRHRLRATLEEMVRRLKRDPQQWYHTNNLPLLAEEKAEAGPEEQRKAHEP